jgi:hypothetical protein
MNIRKGWLRCEISDGILPEEYAIQCSSSDGNTFSFFAPQELINEEKNSVQVNVMECQQDHCLVYVPFEPLEGSSRTIKVSAIDLTEIK